MPDFRLLERTHPLMDLISSSLPTDLPQIYRYREVEFSEDKPWIICVIGPSGAGKDSIIGPAMKEGLLHMAVTATTRDRREGESEEAQVWMRKRREDEKTVEEYHAHLIEEYDLIEYDPHHENLYGLPRKSLEEASAKGTVLLRSDVAAVKTYHEKLSDKYNIATIFVVPESYEQIWERMNATGRTNLEVRFNDSVDYVKDAPDVTNYYLYNQVYVKTADGDYLPGLDVSRESFSQLVDRLTNFKPV